MLDEAIEYLKSLQLQLQVCGTFWSHRKENIQISSPAQYEGGHMSSLSLSSDMFFLLWQLSEKHLLFGELSS